MVHAHSLLVALIRNIMSFLKVNWIMCNPIMKENEVHGRLQDLLSGDRGCIPGARSTRGLDGMLETWDGTCSPTAGSTHRGIVSFLKVCLISCLHERNVILWLKIYLFADDQDC